MMNMTEHMLSDDMMDAVSGGTATETDELTALLGVDKYSLNETLKAYGVTGTALFSANNKENTYVLADGSTISHTQLIERIKANNNH